MYLIPNPKKTDNYSGEIYFMPHNFICLDSRAAMGLRRQTLEFANKLGRLFGFVPEITTYAPQNGDIVIEINDGMDEQAYCIDSTGDYIVISGGEKGLFYGLMTFLQIAAQKGLRIPALRIEDWPDMKIRGFYYDVSRGRIPTLSWLKSIVDRMAAYKLNQFQIYVEHTYLFRDMTELWRDDTPLTAEEILELDRYCMERNIELVPSLSSFGHLFKLLSTKTYSHLCELSNADEIPYSPLGRMDHHTINVLDPESMKLIKAMLSEFMGLFTSKQFNICADETFDLGRDKNKDYARENGKERLYIDYVKEIALFVKAAGKTPMFWGDIIAGFPEMIKELPEDIICLNWGYAWNQREEESRRFAEVGARMYCCPGCCGWNEFINLLDNSYSNIRLMCGYAMKYQALGVLNTDWGDFLHINHPDISTPAMIYGAAYSWNVENTPGFEEINKGISRLEYHDSSESIINIIAKTNGKTAFGWNAACRLKDIKEELQWYMRRNTDYLRESMVSMEDVDRKNDQLEAILTELSAVLPHMDAESTGRVFPMILGIRGMIILNKIGKIVAQREFSMEFDNMPDGCKLAKELETWFYSYRKAYRSISKEGELFRITDLISFYGDYLRRDMQHGQS